NGRRISVFSENRKLLGFYEEKWDGMAHLSFQGAESNIVPAAKAVLEARVSQTLDGGGGDDADEDNDGDYDGGRD
ncbi:unnamed protein product, partial [Laminaria digitata]